MTTPPEPPLPLRVVEGMPPDSANRLSLTQTRALSWRVLTGGETLREVAAYAGVDESTVRYWLRNNARFAELWARATDATEEVTRALRVHGRLKSLQTLIDVQDREGVPASVQVDAAAKFLTNDSRQRQDDRADVTMEMYMDRWLKEAAEQGAIDGEARRLDEGGK